MKPTVAVVIPFYNGAKWIERAVKSVVSQSVAPDEFVVVNDGSRSDQRDELAALSKIYGFRIIDKTNGGQGSARNAGVLATTSEFISFLDQDDFYFNGHIADLMSLVPEDDYRLGFVYADVCTGDEAGNIVNSNFLRQQPGHHPKQGHVATLLSKDMYILPSATLIKRSAYVSIGGFDEQFMGYEDDDLFLRLFRAGYSHYFLDKPVTVWCMYPESTSRSIKMSRSRFKYFKKLVTLYPDNYYEPMFYLRDCLIGRFGGVIIDEAKKANKSGSDNRDELTDILREFCDIVSANERVPERYKRKIRRKLNWINFIRRIRRLPEISQNIRTICRKVIPQFGI